MKEVVITADSTCDLPKSIIEKNNIVITPLSILLGAPNFSGATIAKTHPPT